MKINNSYLIQFWHIITFRYFGFNGIVSLEDFPAWLADDVGEIGCTLNNFDVDVDKKPVRKTGKIYKFIIRNVIYKQDYQ
jgi:hypothetical protein